MARALAAMLLAGLLAMSAGAATPKRGGTLTVVIRPGTTCLNPFSFGACNLITADPKLTQVLEGAFEVGPDLVFRPNLVSRVTIGRNPFTLTYHIRPEARWSDGVPVTADDFGFTHGTLATHPTTDPVLREIHARILRFRKLGAKTFRLELREPYAYWRLFFSLVLPAHALAGEDLRDAALWRDRIDNPKTGRPIGNGPFLVSRLEPGKQLTLVRNRNYWGPHTAYLDRLVLRFGGFDPADPLGPLRRNEVDLVGNTPGSAEVLGPEVAAEAKRITGWGVVTWPSLFKEQLVFRVRPGGHPALRNKLVRRALAYGIDRVEIARRLYPDLGGRARPLDSMVFFPGEQFYRPNWSVYRHDPARARRLLEQAGCRRGADGIYSCAGERLRLRFLTTAGIAHREQALRLIEGQLRRIGVDVEPTYVPGPTLFRTRLPAGDFDAALVGWFVPPGGGVTPEGRCGDERNWAGYCSRLTMRDVQQTDRIVDPSLRARALDDVDEKLVRDVPVLPLYQGVIRAALKDTVRGFVSGGSFIQFHENSEDWWLAR